MYIYTYICIWPDLVLEVNWSESRLHYYTPLLSSNFFTSVFSASIKAVLPRCRHQVGEGGAATCRAPASKHAAHA